MNENILEKSADMQDIPEEGTYQRYSYPPEKGGLGGIINEGDYNSALSRLEKAESGQEIPDKNYKSQVETMTNFAKINLGSGKHAYRAAKLYEILHRDVRPEGVKYHHDSMSDQKLFREVLRMLGDTDSLDNLKAAHHTNRPPGTYCPLCGRKEESEDCP